jgi:hypothetical protein
MELRQLKAKKNFTLYNFDCWLIEKILSKMQIKYHLIKKWGTASYLKEGIFETQGFFSDLLQEPRAYSHPAQQKNSWKKISRNVPVLNI